MLQIIIFQIILQLINTKKSGLKRSLKFFSVDFNPTDANGILDIYRYLIKGK